MSPPFPDLTPHPHPPKATPPPPTPIEEKKKNAVANFRPAASALPSLTTEFGAISLDARHPRASVTRVSLWVIATVEASFACSASRIACEKEAGRTESPGKSSDRGGGGGPGSCGSHAWAGLTQNHKENTLKIAAKPKRKPLQTLVINP